MTLSHATLSCGYPRRQHWLVNWHPHSGHRSDSLLDSQVAGAGVYRAAVGECFCGCRLRHHGAHRSGRYHQGQYGIQFGIHCHDHRTGGHFWGDDRAQRGSAESGEWIAQVFWRKESQLGDAHDRFPDFDPGFLGRGLGDYRTHHLRARASHR